MVETLKQKNVHLEAIQNKLQEKLPDLCQKYGVRSLGIFGSYIHGTQTKRSDLDRWLNSMKMRPLLWSAL